MLPPAGRHTRAIPLNAASNGRELSEICSIFGRSESDHPQSTTRIDGIDRDFLFGNTRPPCSHSGCNPFPSRLGTTQVRQGLALVYTNYYIVYLGFKTPLGLPSMSLGALTSRVGQGGVQIPSPVLLHVSV